MKVNITPAKKPKGISQRAIDFWRRLLAWDGLSRSTWSTASSPGPIATRLRGGGLSSASWLRSAWSWSWAARTATTQFATDQRR